MTCRELIEFLMAYLDGELEADRREAFERHLKVCASCVAYVETYRRATEMCREVMRASDDPVPGSVPEALVAAILAARAGG